MVKIDTLFESKTARKPCALGPHISIYSYKGVPPKDLKRVMTTYRYSLRSFCEGLSQWLFLCKSNKKAIIHNSLQKQLRIRFVFEATPSINCNFQSTHRNHFKDLSS